MDFNEALQAVSVSALVLFGVVYGASRLWGWMRPTWPVMVFVILCLALFVAAIRPDEPRLELHVFCLPDRQCPPCAAFHRDASEPPLKETLAGFAVHKHSQFDARDWAVDRFPTFVVARGGSQVRRMVGYTSPNNLVRFLEGK